MSGRDLLGRINRNLTQARATVEGLDAETGTASAELAAIRQEQSDILRRLAELRVDRLDRGAVEGLLSGADERAGVMLERRETAMAELDVLRQQLRVRLQAAEEARLAAAEAAREAAAALAANEAEVQALLADDADWRLQLEAARTANAVATAAERKAQQARSDRVSKGAAYEGEPPFMYLWSRGYGTSQYRANPVARLLDGWVARLCGYQQARPNYAMLLEIPRRLTEHAVKRRTAADDQGERLEQLERAAAERYGMVPLEAALDAAEAEIDAVDVRIDALETEQAALSVRSGEFAAGDDADMRAAVEMLTDAMRRGSAVTLQEQAAATEAVDDDMLVMQLAAARDAEHDLDRELADRRRAARGQQERLRELETLRQQFKRKRYDDMRSQFEGRDVIAMMFEQFMGGLLGSDELWRVISRRQRHADVGAWPDFGSGGLPGRSGPWRNPGGGGFRLPTPGRGSPRGGGFRTGGGF